MRFWVPQFHGQTGQLNIKQFLVNIKKFQNFVLHINFVYNILIGSIKIKINFISKQTRIFHFFRQDFKESKIKLNQKTDTFFKIEIIGEFKRIVF